MEAPAQPQAQTRPAPRPASPKVYGILSIIFASIMILVSLIGTLGIGVGSVVAEMRFFLEREGIPSHLAGRMVDSLSLVYTVGGVQSLVMLAMSGLLLAIGIGQVQYRRWAGGLAFVWGIVGLAVVLGFTLVHILWTGPAYAGIFEVASQVDTELHRLEEIVSGVGVLVGSTMAIFWVLFFTPYPLLQLIFFSKQKIRAAMVN